ncbi:MAG: DUF1844 domain-containing protein [Candidatus Auribacterota bacterium]
MEKQGRSGTNNYESEFIGLISLLSNTALQQMGKIINPYTGTVSTHLEAARFTIDLLEMLKIKTAGNLSQKENDILTSYLSNLQMNYADTMKETGSSGKNSDTSASEESDIPDQVQNG